MPHRTSILARTLLALPVLSATALGVPSCMVGLDESAPITEPAEPGGDRSTQNIYTRIRDVARARGLGNAYLLAGLAKHEGELALCLADYPFPACPGPASAECGGGPVLAGGGDGPCYLNQGGLGMFQFDAGTFSDTLATYGNGILTVDGQANAAVDYVINMVKISYYTTNAETDDKARAWINAFDINNPVLRDQWISTALRHYNGCPPEGSCWAERYPQYNEALSEAINEPGGLAFWGGSAGTRCGNSPAAVGLIEAKYLALGGCGSILGAPILDEQATLNGDGKFSVFERGSIYWTPAIGAFEVHGVIRDQWKAVGWETGVLGYPISDEVTTPDQIGRFNVFERGSIYWTPDTGAHEVLGTIRDTWASLGWEAGALGYPVSGEYAIAGGRASDFQHGTIAWNASTNATTVTMAP